MNLEKPFLPIKVNVYLTNYCTYECEYCFLKEINQLNTSELSQENIDKVIFYMNKYSVPLVSICGGDPLISNKFPYIVKELSANRNYVVTATNAIDLSKEYLEEIKENGIRYLQIGIDRISNKKEVNYKEDNHIDKVLNSVKYMKEIGIKYGLATCVTKQNINEIESLIDFAHLHNFELLKIAIYNGENKNFKLSDVEIDNLLTYIQNYNSTSNNFIKCSLVPASLHFTSDFPIITVNTNGDIVIEDNNVKIGNLSVDDPGIVYLNYIKTNKGGNLE